MSVAFFGSSDYCLPVLESLKNNFDLDLVITRPDKPVGRKQILTPSATKVWAQKNEISVETNLSNLLTYSPTDLGLVADFGQIIPENIFNVPKLGTFNIHFSKLPDLRGASPIQSTLLRGDTTAWITIFKLEKTLDTGPILWQKEYKIFPTETASDLYTRLFTEAAKEMPSLLLKPGTWNLIPQSGQPTFCKKLTKDDGFIEWKNIDDPSTYNLEPRTLYNRYRALYPWPGLWTIKDGRRMKILKCHLEENKLVLDEIQFEGGKSKTPSQGLSL